MPDQNDKPNRLSKEEAEALIKAIEEVEREEAEQVPHRASFADGVPADRTDGDAERSCLAGHLSVMTENVSDRVVALEELLSHQQHIIQQLNDVVVELRGQLDNLAARQQIHEQRLKTLMESYSNIEDDPHEKPPHY